MLKSIDVSGSILWTLDGVAICTATGDQEFPQLENDGTGGAIITWQDFRGSNMDIYASLVFSSGVLPVELVNFTASFNNSNIVVLNWETSSEVKSYGFEIQRASKLLNQSISWEKVGFIFANGNSNSPKQYSFSDKLPSFGKYSYRLKQIDNDGKFVFSNEIELEFLNISSDYILSQNYPNPFNPATKIKFNIPTSVMLNSFQGADGENSKKTIKEDVYVQLKVYDILGNEIATLVNEEKNLELMKLNL